MKKTMLSLGAVALGLSLAAPASATQIHRQFHILFHPAAVKTDTMPKTDAAPKTDVVDAAKSLDCSSGTYASDGADLASADVTATADGSGGCKLSVSIDSAAVDFSAIFADTAGTSHKYYRKFVKDDAIPSHTIDLKL